MASSLSVHQRYYAPHKLRGTPPRWKTIKRLMVQKKLGLSLVSKRIWLGDKECHPTKGPNPTKRSVIA